MICTVSTVSLRRTKPTLRWLLALCLAALLLTGIVATAHIATAHHLVGQSTYKWDWSRARFSGQRPLINSSYLRRAPLVLQRDFGTHCAASWCMHRRRQRERG